MDGPDQPLASDPGEPSTSDALTIEETAFLDQYSGTVPDREALLKAISSTQHARATTSMPEVPHIDALREALPGPTNRYEAVLVTAFVNNGKIYDPRSDRDISVRNWLESGRDVQPVLDLAETLKYSQ